MDAPQPSSPEEDFFVIFQSVFTLYESPSQLLSPLEELPRDIVWSLIEYAPESVYHLRLTSRLLKYHVDEYARQPQSMPLVDEIIVNTEIYEHNMLDRIYLYVPHRKSGLFELRLKCRQPRNPNISNYYQMKREKESEYFCYSPRWTSWEMDYKVFNFLKDCIGKHIANKVFIDYKTKTSLDDVSKLLNGMQIPWLEVYFDPLSEIAVEHLLEPIEKWKVQKLSVTVYEVKIADPVALLLRLSSLVSSLHIEQLRMEERIAPRGYFFGVRNANWAPIIVDMLSSKLDKLYIENYFWPEYLNDGIDELKERIPLLNKKIWFLSTPDPLQTYESITTVNDRIVKTNHRTDWYTALSVVHVSRANEKFDISEE